VLLELGDRDGHFGILYGHLRQFKLRRKPWSVSFFAISRTHPPLARVFALLREPGEGLAGVPGGLGEGGAAGDAAGGGQGLGARRAAEKKIGRKINPTLYKPAELRRKRAERNSFIVRVLQQPKIFVIGSDGELE